MMEMQGPWERHRQHGDPRDGQTADEQNTLRSTFHCRISISMRALGSGAHPELSRIGPSEMFIACGSFVSAAGLALNGLGEMPVLAGQSPVNIARQLYLMATG